MRTYSSLEEIAGWPYDEDDNPPVITEADIDFAAEIAEADELAEHNRLESAENCCGGRNWYCIHYGRA